MVRHYDDLGASPEKATPKSIYEPFRTAIGGFDLDAASGAEVEPIAPHRLTKDEDALTTPWWGDVWINPPYGRDHNPVWADRILNQSTSPWVSSVTALVPMSCSTDWWHRVYANADVIVAIDGKIKFLDDEGDLTDHNASFASCVAYFGEQTEAIKRAGEELGCCLQRVHPAPP